MGFRKKRNCTIRVAKTKTLISFAVTAKLICVFVFAYADCWVSHEVAHFIEAVNDISQYLINFNASVKVDSIFLKYNFLKLNVFYRQLSYEYVCHQKGYNIFGLICDIGGSMGLFIGASMLSIVEVIDLLLGHMPLFGKNTKRNPSDNNETVHKA